MPNVLIFCLVKVAMLGQFEKDYVALNLPSVGTDANGNRGWPKRSLWRVRNVIVKVTFLKVVHFSQDLLPSCLDQQVGVTASFGRLTFCQFHKNWSCGLKVEMDVHTQHCGLINILLPFKESCTITV